MEDLQSLITAARTGDLDAYSQVVGRFQDMAFGYAYSVLGDFHLAEDASQEAFVEAYRCLSGLREAAAFPGWFRRIVFKHCDRLLRSRRPAPAPLDVVATIAARGPAPAERAEMKETEAKVLEAIRSLPEHERTVTTLFYINGYSQETIAGFLEAPVGTVKSRLHSSRNHLRERMIDMVEETLKSHRPGPEQRQAIIDELKGRLAQFNQQSWPPDQGWADKWHARRIEDVRANAVLYGIDLDEALPRMLAEYQACRTFRDDFEDVPRRWGVPEGTKLVLLRELCRAVGATPLAVRRWADEGLSVLRYHPWSGYDQSMAKQWIADRGVKPEEQMTSDDARQPLLLTLRALAAGEASVAEAEGVFSALMSSTIAGIPGDCDGKDMAAVKLDPLWDAQWRARWPLERTANAKLYGLAEPSPDHYGVPEDVLSGRVFEIRDFCRRLEVSPFDVVRWTRDGMPCVRCSPSVRWDIEHTAVWLGSRGFLPADRPSYKDLDNLETFVLPAVADGSGSSADAQEIFAGWAGLV